MLELILVSKRRSEFPIKTRVSQEGSKLYIYIYYKYIEREGEREIEINILNIYLFISPCFCWLWEERPQYLAKSHRDQTAEVTPNNGLKSGNSPKMTEKKIRSRKYK